MSDPLLPFLPSGYCIDHTRQYNIAGASGSAEPAAGESKEAKYTQALKFFEGFRDKTSLVRVYAEATKDFTETELNEYTKTFVKFDVNKSGCVVLFALVVTSAQRSRPVRIEQDV